MLILAFDTTSDMGGVGIFRDGESLVEIPNEGPTNRYSITLFEMVGQALAGSGVELRDIDLYAVARGPGSFTGIRVGLAAARAWGKAFDRPVRGISVLDAMVNKLGLRAYRLHLSGSSPENSSSHENGTPAFRLAGEHREFGSQGSLLHESPPAPEWCFPILDARRGEFFIGAFRKVTCSDTSRTGHATELSPRLHPAAAGKQAYESAGEGWVLSPAQLTAFLEARLGGGATATCLLRANDLAASALRDTLPASLGWQAVDGVLVASIADVARTQTASGGPRSDTHLDAYYIRRPDAELN